MGRGPRVERCSGSALSRLMSSKSSGPAGVDCAYSWGGKVSAQGKPTFFLAKATLGYEANFCGEPQSRTFSVFRNSQSMMRGNTISLVLGKELEVYLHPR